MTSFNLMYVLHLKICHTKPSSSPSEGILPQTILGDSSSDYQLNDHAAGLNIDLN